jgi:type IX secretion system PorP/SprF family membrane protein
MKKIGLILVTIAVNFSLSAQQLSMYSQYYWNDFVINPAFTGIKNTPRVQLGYRNQWSGFKGAPKTYSIGGHTSLKNNNMGLGGMIFSDDQGGAIQQNGVMLNYSYNLKLDKLSGISFGIAGILNQYGYNGSDIQNINPDATLQTNVRQLVPDLNFGVVYHLKNKLYIGLASNQLIQSRLKKLNQFSTSENQLIRHYNLSASYISKINSTLTAEPYAMLRTTFIKAPQVELGAKMTYNDFVFGGLSYRNKESVIGLIGLNYMNFVFAYSYDFTLSTIRNYSSGSHEVLLAYQFNKKSKTQGVVIEQATQPRDSDGDGVADNEDLCPNVKGIKEYKGCPDTDGDGVFDDLDECPKVLGPKDNKGCPWPDSDNDGLSDNKDDCPTISGPVENRGCPYGDTDGDGVNDNVDPCPKTTGPVENKGCPVIEKKDQKVIDMAFKNLEFETSKDIIEESSKPSLNSLAEKLKQKPEWNLLLSGHTDNDGDDDANMILSKNRSETVKSYLISRGISESRIRVNYFGETEPVANNNTSEGRQKNRRVEFVILFE